MTRQELEEYKYLRIEVEYLRKKISREKQMIAEYKYWHEYVSAAADIIKIYEDRLNKSKLCMSCIEKFLNGIEDPMYRELLHLRYVAGLNWVQIYHAMTAKGYYYSCESYRSLCHRYLKKCNQCEGTNLEL